MPSADRLDLAPAQAQAANAMASASTATAATPVAPTAVVVPTVAGAAMRAAAADMARRATTAHGLLLERAGLIDQQNSRAIESLIEMNVDNTRSLGPIPGGGE